MRTEYELWIRPGSGDDPRWAPAGRHQTVEDAMAAAGLPDPSDWRQIDDRRIAETPDGTSHHIDPERIPECDADRIALAIDIALEYGQFDGDHHKAWCIDQMLRALTGDQYDTVITEYRDGDDGPDTYGWDEGIAP